MARPTMRSVRDNIDAIRIGKTGLANDQHYKRRILEREYEATGNLAIAAVLARQTKEEERQQASKFYNTKRRQTRKNDCRPMRKVFRSPEGSSAASWV